MVQGLACGQLSTGHDVAVAAVLDRNAPEPPVVSAIRTHGGAVYAFRPPSRAYRAEQGLVGEACDRFRPDIVHTHGYRADVLHGRVARKRGIPTVTTVHGFTGGDWKNRLYERLQRRAHRRFDGVVAVSEPLKAELADAGVPSDRIYCIRNAWVRRPLLDRSAAREQLGLDANRIWVGFVGRLSREKGADIFVEAVARLDDARGAVIGTGSLRAALEARAEAADVAGRVRFIGMVPNAGRFMKALDVFVLSSRTEGTPIALLEAMAAGVPVVATRVGGVPDVVSEAEAKLVEPERPTELAAAIGALLADRRSAQARARRARRKLRAEFSPEVWISRYDRVYAQATAAASDRI